MKNYFNKKRVLKTYNKKAKNFDHSKFIQYSHIVHDYIFNKFEFNKKHSILDLGCGTGELLFRLHKEKQPKLAGIDISPEMIKIANEKIGQNIDLKIGDAEELPWDDNKFDFVLCTYSFHHYPRPQKSLLEVYRVLKPKGKFIIGDFWTPTPFRQLINLFSPFSKVGDVRIYSRSEMEYMLNDSGFTKINWELINNQAFFVSGTIKK